MATKVTIDGKEYCVETLLHEVKRLKRELTIQAEANKQSEIGMLTEIQLEIEELDSRAGYGGNGMPTFSTDYIRKKKVNELIQQKIDKLKEQ